MTATERRLREVLHLGTLDEARAHIVGKLLREDRRQRQAARQLLEECRRELRDALAPPLPNVAAVLELSVQERLLDERQRTLSAAIEARILEVLNDAERARAAARVERGPALATL